MARPSTIKRRKPRRKISTGQFLREKACEMRKKPTAAEKALQDKLIELDIKHAWQKPYTYRGYSMIFDFFFSKQKLIIEVDGGYHYGEEQKINDDIRDTVCRDNLGFAVVRITNKYAHEISLEHLKSIVEDRNF